MNQNIRNTILNLVILLISLTSLMSCVKAENIKTNQKQQLPVKVYMMSFESAPELNSTFDKSKIIKAFEYVNKIWSVADIEWVIEEIIPLKIDNNKFDQVERYTKTKRTFRNKLADLIDYNNASKNKELFWQVAIFKKFPIAASGVYVPEKKTVFYSELNKNGQEQFVVLAHELGHTLGLKHVDGEDNLMATGKNKNPDITLKLTDEQITTAKQQAELGPFSMKGSMYTNNKSKQHNKSNNAMKGNRTNNNGMNEKRKKIVQRLMRHDRNNDGRISLLEVPPRAIRIFKKIDTNNDKMLSAQEIRSFSN